MIPGGINPLLLSGSGGYQIQRSLRLRSAASAFLNRTFSAGSQTTWTFSKWIKRGALGQQNILQTGGAGGSVLYFGSGDDLHLSLTIGSAESRVTSQVFRDPSAWMHLLIALDTTQATAANRVKIYVNGTQLTSFSTSSDPALNATFAFNQAAAHMFGQSTAQLSGFFDGYVSDFHWIGGQALTPASFGQFDANGMWQPKAYVGTYGTNGFRLDFADNTSTTTLMADRSGNGNNWTANNISLTAGATYDSMIDVPLGAGGAERGNYATWSPLDATTNKPTNGNLRVGHNAAEATRATTFQSSGKWYYEFVYDTLGSGSAVGIGKIGAAYTQAPGFDASGYGFNPNTGNKNNAGSSTAYGAACATGDVIGVAYDLDNGKIWWAKNGVWQASGDPAAGTNPAFSGVSGEFAPMFGISNVGSGAGGSATFGQRPFTYSPPAGFKALHTGNMPAPTIAQPNKHFDTLLWAGDGNASRTITGLQFTPDFGWLKSRTGGTYHHWQVDSVRGASKTLFSDAVGAELTDRGLSAFVSGGFTLDGQGNSVEANTSGHADVGWLWKAGGAAVANNAGSISAQVSANPSAGFSIASYTGTGANATVGHGLGVAPKMVIVKCRSAAIASPSWAVWHTAIAGTQYLDLQATIAASTAASIWNSTTPTSSVFSLGTSATGNQNTSTYVAYCFAEIPGFSKFGSYTGNGSADGPFVYCGFKPRFVMAKLASSAGGNWVILDSARDAFNVGGRELLPNAASAEAGPGSSDLYVDFTANGFKIRGTRGDVNNSGATYIFAAFAEAPFNSALAR